MQETRKYNYIDINKQSKSIELPIELYNKEQQAKKDYEKSFTYIQQQEYYIWRQALKSYHLSTYDRKNVIQPRQSNISIGLVRSFVDSLTSTVQEKPLNFYGVGLNKKGIQNKENIINTLNYISDTTKFHTQIKKCLADGLIIGEIAMRVGFISTQKQEKVVSIINNEYVEETIDMKVINTPYAESVSMFNIFPDMYSGPLRYVTERGVVSYENFIEVFGSLIRSKLNESTMKDDDFLKLLPINQNGADFSDYGNIVNQIHLKINDELREQDYYLDDKITHPITQGYTTQDRDGNVTEGLIEFLITYYNNKIILRANGYPVYIGKNIYGFIPYVIKASNNTEARIGEGIPYLLKGLEDVWNSFTNNYFDSARSLANPTMVVNKNLLINDNDIEDGTPGKIVYTESNDGGNVIYRLDKGGLNDFNIGPMIQQIAQQITGISEYNLGQSAGERTASGALAVTSSSIRRMSPYMSNFMDAVSCVAVMWLELVKKFWTSEQWIYILDDQGKQTESSIKSTDLTGDINISLQAEGLFGSYNELEFNKLLSLYTTTAPSGIVKSPEVISELYKKAGYAPSRFLVEENMTQIKPDNANDLSAQANQLNQPGANLPDLLSKMSNPQINLGNGGKGQ